MADYTQSCVSGGACTCDYNFFLRVCGLTVDNCTCSCPAPLANSHYVSDSCAARATCTNPPICPCGCSCLGNCVYDCDAGFFWNGSACVPIPSDRSYARVAWFLKPPHVPDPRPYEYAAWKKIKRHYDHKSPCGSCASKREAFERILARP